MTTPAATPESEEFAAMGGLEPIERIKRRWPVLLGAALSVLMVVGLARELLEAGLAGLSRTVPDSPLFYLAFAVAYLASPVGDFVIFRRLWQLPVAGLGALLRKRIANDVVIGYSGDVYFYVWARQRMKMVTSPFGAVKDVTILSGIAANSLTLLMIALVLPIASDLLSRSDLRMVALSAAIIFALSAPFVIFSKRVFSLGRRQLWQVFGIHAVRFVLDSAALALAWHLAMPDVSLGMWSFLVAGRLLVFRMPLIPNKELVFATFAILFIGQSEALGDLVAFTSALNLLCHLVLIALFGLFSLIKTRF
ncbi:MULTISPECIES: hypothetical protein [unclassified Sphingomonas]|uniref:hypothetical protein n=1 Tax=unclassified Sphingomonas TaxID=196159 RepID=UPI0008335A33|nr:MULTISPECIES: hypothetical protein [unclassified Sphingomonas]